MSVNAAQHFMNQAQLHLTFPILVITKIFAQTDIKGAGRIDIAKDI